MSHTYIDMRFISLIIEKNLRNECNIQYPLICIVNCIWVLQHNSVNNFQLIWGYNCIKLNSDADKNGRKIPAKYRKICRGRNKNTIPGSQSVTASLPILTKSHLFSGQNIKSEWK